MSTQIDPEIHQLIDAEFDRAHAKHGGKTPRSWSVGDLQSLVILMEEVGEVARLLAFPTREGNPCCGTETTPDQAPQGPTSEARQAQEEAMKETPIPERGTEDYRRRAVLFNDISWAPINLGFADRLRLRGWLWEQGWRRDVRPEDVTESERA